MKKGRNECACLPRGTKIEWFPPPTLPHVEEGPKEAESRYGRIPPTPVCRDEVGLTSWRGKPLHQPAHLEQPLVLRHPLEFRKLPCIRGCRLTGLVASSSCRLEGGVEPLREKKGKELEAACPIPRNLESAVVKVFELCRLLLLFEV